MKRLLLIFGLLLSAVTIANAQGRAQMGTPEERATRQLSQLESLKLNQEQKVKLASVFLRSANQVDSIRATLNGDFSAMRSKLMPVQEETNKMINLILKNVTLLRQTFVR